jgi:p-aminobenzoyl-glutamate transporter AbgT
MVLDLILAQKWKYPSWVFHILHQHPNQSAALVIAHPTICIVVGVSKPNANRLHPKLKISVANNWYLCTLLTGQLRCLLVLCFFVCVFSVKKIWKKIPGLSVTQMSERIHSLSVTKI